ncbi:MAG: 50S ribosomal protein L17 [candidate division Zixibacteria bacterium]|nr:50S ribosomal protein L17 [candidate division Zixibacteria bacterium]
MRHAKTTHKLGVKTNHRVAMLRNMVTSLFQHGRITTTHARAQALKPLAEKLVTLAKTDTVHSRRIAAETIQNREVLQKLFNTIAPEMSDRNGGYTRVMKKGFRKGDNAELSIVELVNYKPEEREAKDEDKKKKK